MPKKEGLIHLWQRFLFKCFKHSVACNSIFEYLLEQDEDLSPFLCEMSLPYKRNVPSADLSTVSY